MLDAYIIDDLKRQEEDRRKSEDGNRPRLYIDPPRPMPRRDSEVEEEDESEDRTSIYMP